MPDLTRKWTKAQVSKVLDDLEQVRVQLAGCLMAAEGWGGKDKTPVKGDWAWSPAFQAVRDLREHYQLLYDYCQSMQQHRDSRAAKILATIRKAQS
jgi:hypothetical protein